MTWKKITHMFDVIHVHDPENPKETIDIYGDSATPPLGGEESELYKQWAEKNVSSNPKFDEATKDLIRRGFNCMQCGRSFEGNERKWTEEDGTEESVISLYPYHTCSNCFAQD